MFGKIGRALGGVGRAMGGAAGMVDPGGQRRAMLGGAGPRGAKNAFGGAIKRRGQGGFMAAAEPTVAPPAPESGGMQGAWSAEMATPEPNPYGPSQIRPENAPGRIMTRRLAGMQMLGR